ncbi:hypothetical protein RMSM_06231 [Rhodopirellula maiorica SM1]|uniref:HEAT repeat domain-containing protein n=1 Tax=Rhodopirellula maiorica SM1 TaxID=1265738 RepID=M5RCQ7_9BACT|nr:hypothetical protein [Rhodopirellula maiorica]EMI16836.1 hypothetical protein RMSM_06231 [Rhodopirellula maiorica SM1]
MFFKPKANLSDAEKSRIELCLQQIAECVGFERFTLPVLSPKTLFGVYESERDPQQVIQFVGKHLDHDVSGIQVRVFPQLAQSSCGGGCGGGSCDGPGGLPGRYDAAERTITLDLRIDSDPPMGLATLINGVVCDLLSQNNLDSEHLPERVDLAVVAMGLGMIRSSIGLVAKQPTCWDSTQWELIPRPFLDCQSLAYANASAAWARDDATPEWSNDLPSDVKRSMRKSLKFLLKTNDSFFQPRAKRSLLTQSQSEWWKLAASVSASNQVIAIRHLESDGKLDDPQESLLLEKLCATNRAILLNAIAATERMASKHPTVVSESVVRELRTLTDHRDDEVRAKAMCVLAKLGKLHEATIETATEMLEDHQKHLVFAGVYALSTLDSVPERVVPSMDRCFVRVLRACDYEFIDLIVTAYRRWLDDPQSHFEGLLQDSPEHLPIALETLQKAPEPLVQIRRGA